MNSRFYFFAIIILLAHVNLQAKQVSVQKAETVALNFFNLNAPVVKGAVAELNYTKTGVDNTIDFYVFDIKPQGFVIVTADDNFEPVIAYSTESDFHENFNSVGVKDWMDRTAAKIAFAKQHNALANARVTNLWTSYLNGTNPGYVKDNSVKPLLTTNWDQQPFYNALCPFNDTDKVHCVTGCVATTMAQIMKFWNYPAKGMGSFSYNDTTPAFSHYYGVQAADFGETTYSWPTMPASLNTNNSAIATLMYQCGVSVAMDYGDDKEGGSSAYVLEAESGGQPNAQHAYTTYFSYDASTIKGVFASAYSSSGWTSLLEGELNAGRPIQYEGQDPGVGGHTWVCDGYDVNGMFHMNWGWGGYDNGYFSLDSLAVAGANFSTSEAALIGIKPSATTGITDLSAAALHLYPNPTSKFIKVDLEGANNGLVQFAIYNLAGQKVFADESTLTAGLNTREINIDRLESGVYLMEIAESGDLIRQKFVVTK